MAEEVRRMMELRSTEDVPTEEEEKKVPDEKELEEYRDLFGGWKICTASEVKKTPLIEREGRVDLREYLDEMDLDEEEPESEEEEEEEEEEEGLSGEKTSEEGEETRILFFWNRKEHKPSAWH